MQGKELLRTSLPFCRAATECLEYREELQIKDRELLTKDRELEKLRLEKHETKQNFERQLSVNASASAPQFYTSSAWWSGIIACTYAVVVA